MFTGRTDKSSPVAFGGFLRCQGELARLTWFIDRLIPHRILTPWVVGTTPEVFADTGAPRDEVARAAFFWAAHIRLGTLNRWARWVVDTGDIVPVAPRANEHILPAFWTHIARILGLSDDDGTIGTAGKLPRITALRSREKPGRVAH